MKDSREKKLIELMRGRSLHSSPTSSFKKSLFYELNERIGSADRDQPVEVRKNYRFLFAGLATFCLLFWVLVISAVFIPSRLSNLSLPEVSTDSKIAFQPFKSQFEFSQYLSRSEALHPQPEIESPRQVPQSLPVQSEPEALTPDFSSDRGAGNLPTQGYKLPDVVDEKREQLPERVSKTNVQVLGIDEPDIVKVSGKYIYYSSQIGSGGETKIIKAFPANDLFLLSRIQAGGELLIQGETLMVFDDESRKLYGYDISNPSLAREVWAIDLQNDSRQKEARLYAGKLYLVTQTKINKIDPCPYYPLSIKGDLTTIPCDDIYHPFSIVRTDTTFTAMRINPSNGDIEKSLSFIGSSKDSVIYMSRDSLFVAYSLKQDIQSTQIVKIRLADFGIVASGEVPGYLLNQFSLDEYENALRVATTIEDSGSDTWSMNGVYILNKNLQIIGDVTNLGFGERIYSVRFINDKAYVVTFRETDPFYVVDLSDRSNPQVKGQLKIPGYSSYLHPLKSNLILGIGMESGQVKLSLFDVSTPQNPREVSKFLLSEYSSETLSNHHAFTHDAKHQIFFIPGQRGGYVFSYTNNELSRVSTVDLPNTERAVYVNDYLYVLGSSEIVVLNENSWKEENRIYLQ